jgi:hypothetical protein
MIGPETGVLRLPSFLFPIFLRVSSMGGWSPVSPGCRQIMMSLRETGPAPN